uniref:Lysosomal Pro-X carboxypeptidase n=1 Tax=Octactis speculum TaxID=3111310 RepID=A0A7S2CI96_9STRA|mmetsp:Transcript_3569/g.4070  ORF Transcript_3569/g.4070 Transcript_3569/m.4070 type:complete len:370 (+) Transcript_3569:1104-2213(+)
MPTRYSNKRERKQKKGEEIEWLDFLFCRVFFFIYVTPVYMLCLAFIFTPSPCFTLHLYVTPLPDVMLALLLLVLIILFLSFRWPTQSRLAEAGTTAQGRQALSEAFSLCEPLPDDPETGWDLVYWVETALSHMAQGNYPYTSSYFMNGRGEMPPYPIIKACDTFLADDLMATCNEDPTALCPALYEGIASFVGVYYNNSEKLACNDIYTHLEKESTSEHNMLWDYQCCTEIFQAFGQDGIRDVFWPAPWNATSEAIRCENKYAGILPDMDWGIASFGNPDHWKRTTSNIVWSNGELDPWAGAGVMTNLSDSLISIMIPQAAHHLDLMFSNKRDTHAVRWARNFEMAHVLRWIDERRKKIKNWTATTHAR